MKGLYTNAFTGKKKGGQFAVVLFGAEDILESGWPGPIAEHGAGIKLTFPSSFFFKYHSNLV
jgi:hypothetical protein